MIDLTRHRQKCLVYHERAQNKQGARQKTTKCDGITTN